MPHGSVRLATPMVRRLRMTPQAVRCPQKPGPYSVAIERRYTVTKTEGGAAATLGAWPPWSSARIVIGPARVVRNVAANEPFGSGWTTATSVQVAPGVEGSWSISTAWPALPAGTVPVSDTPLRTNAEALVCRVIPSAAALTGVLPGSTGGLVLADAPGLAPPDPDGAPPEPAAASPGSASTPAPAPSSEAR